MLGDLFEAMREDVAYIAMVNAALTQPKQRAVRLPDTNPPFLGMRQLKSDAEVRQHSKDFRVNILAMGLQFHKQS